MNTSGIQADALPYMASAIYGGIKTPYFNPESDKINIDFRKKAPTPMEQAGIFDMLLDNNYAKEYFPAFFNKYKSADYAAELNKGVYAKIFKDVFRHTLPHAHINGIVFYMPLFLFVYMVVGLYIGNIVKKRRKRA